MPLTRAQLLPETLASEIRSYVGASMQPGFAFPVIPCYKATAAYSLTFYLGGPGGPAIQVPMSELVIPRYFADGRQPRFANGATACEFGVAGTAQDTYFFGDTFLRSAYVVRPILPLYHPPQPAKNPWKISLTLPLPSQVYDLDTAQISLAQTIWNQPLSNIVEINPHADGVPSAKSLATAATAHVSYTGVPSNQAAAVIATSYSLSAPAAGSIRATATDYSAALSPPAPTVFAATPTSTSELPSESRKPAVSTGGATGRGPVRLVGANMILGTLSIVIIWQFVVI